MSDVYSIADLARLGGVNRRTVRFYVQERLLPPALGLGRGSHYGPEHLQRLLAVRQMQEDGLSLDAIRAAVSGRNRARAAAAPGDSLPRTSWVRITVAPGVELDIAAGVRVPGPAVLAELADFCRRHFRREEDQDE